MLCVRVCLGCQVNAEDVGTSIGFSHATRSLCGIVSPTVGGYLVASYGFVFAAGYVPAVLSLAAMMFLWSLGNSGMVAEKTKPS